METRPFLLISHRGKLTTTTVALLRVIQFNYNCSRSAHGLLYATSGGRQAPLSLTSGLTVGACQAKKKREVVKDDIMDTSIACNQLNGWSGADKIGMNFSYIAVRNVEFSYLY